MFEPEIGTWEISDRAELSREFLVGVVARDELRITNRVVPLNSSSKFYDLIFKRAFIRLAEMVNFIGKC